MQQAEEVLLRPARARVVLRERRRRPGRSNKADIYYQVGLTLNAVYFLSTPCSPCSQHAC